MIVTGSTLFLWNCLHPTSRPMRASRQHETRLGVLRLNAAHDALVADALSDTHDPSRYCKVRFCWSTIRPGLIFHGGNPQGFHCSSARKVQNSCKYNSVNYRRMYGTAQRARVALAPMSPVQISDVASDTRHCDRAEARNPQRWSRSTRNWILKDEAWSQAGVNIVGRIKAFLPVADSSRQANLPASRYRIASSRFVFQVRRRDLARPHHAETHRQRCSHKNPKSRLCAISARGVFHFGRESCSGRGAAPRLMCTAISRAILAFENSGRHPIAKDSSIERTCESPSISNCSLASKR